MRVEVIVPVAGQILGAIGRALITASTTLTPWCGFILSECQRYGGYQSCDGESSLHGEGKTGAGLMCEVRLDGIHSSW